MRSIHWRRGHRRGTALSVSVVVLVMVGPAALAHITSGNRDNWGSHSYTDVNPSFDPIGTSGYTTNLTGSHVVYTNATDGVTCQGAGNTYWIRTVHELPLQPDEISLPLEYTCGTVSNHSYSWANDTGSFHLDIGKDQNACATCIWTAKGHTHYP